MGIFDQAHALRANSLGVGLAMIMALGLNAMAPTIGFAAGTPGQVELDPSAGSTQPFGLSATILPGGGLLEKWRSVQHQLDDEMVQLALCEGDPERCVSPAALKFLAVVEAAKARDGRARLGEINRAINLAIRPMSDLAQYGEIDVWSSPLATFASGAGDCEDYAIAKFVALRRAGISPDDLRIVIMRDTIRSEDHAVAAARLDGHWLMLDNNRMAMIEDIDVRNYRPIFVINQTDVFRYIDTPLLAHVPNPDFPAALAQNSIVQPGTIASHN
jgi:predicted transglutaminase-like cysteine proteinase